MTTALSGAAVDSSSADKVLVAAGSLIIVSY